MPKLFTQLSAIAAFAALPLAVPASAEVIEQGEDGFVTRDSVVVAASPYDTWAALIAPGKWWNDAHTWSMDASNMYISAQGGGCFCELMPEKPEAPDSVRRGSVRHMVVLLADPPQALRMRGGLGPLQSEPVDGVLTITMQPEGEGTRIVWEYVVGGYMRFEVPMISKAVDAVMSQQLAGLATLLGRIDASATAGGAEEEEEMSVAEEVPVEDTAGQDDANDVGATLDAMANDSDGR